MEPRGHGRAAPRPPAAAGGPGLHYPLAGDAGRRGPRAERRARRGARAGGGGAAGPGGGARARRGAPRARGARRRAVRSAEAFAAERDRLSDDMRTTVLPDPHRRAHRAHVSCASSLASGMCGVRRCARSAADTRRRAPRERRAVSLLHYPLLARGLHCPLKRSAAYPRVRYTPYP
jgi:hypothetical protein